VNEDRPGAPAPGVNPPPQERSTAGRSPEAGEEQARSEEQWEERLRASVEATLRARAARRAERQQFALRRMHGLAARHAAKLARINQEKAMKCRYLNRHAVQCTGEPVDLEGEVLLCTRHLGQALELLKARGFTITAPATGEKEN
jgi:hypothetical protein